MRTENLTAILAANLEPDAKQTMWRHVLGINAGALAALILSVGILRVSETMERIHHDEARHVAIASRCARPLLKSIRGREIAMEGCERLITLLHLRAGSLDLLSVDPDRLCARVRAPPRLA